MSVKRLGSGALRFQVMPLDRAEFHAAIDELDVLPQSEHCEQHFIGPQLHFLQATIAGHLLASKEDMERAGRMLRGRLAEPTSGSLYTVRAHDIVDGMTEIPAIARNPSTPNTL